MSDGSLEQIHSAEAEVVTGVAGDEPTGGEPRVGEIGSDLLQAQDVEIGDALRLGHDARGIDASIHAAAPLGVPGHDNHAFPTKVMVLHRHSCERDGNNSSPPRTGGPIFLIHGPILTLNWLILTWKNGFPRARE